MQLPRLSIVDPVGQEQLSELELKTADVLHERQELTEPELQVAQENWQGWQIPFESMKKPLLQRHLELVMKALILQLRQFEGELTEQVAQVLSQGLQSP
jgi:hypothetical protein